jgi:SAM-dependent methyltransferase
MIIRVKFRWQHGSFVADRFDPQTMEFYQGEAPVYTASGPQGASRHLQPFLGRLQCGASILELGCGGGLDAQYMIGQGFAVEPTDGVPAIAAKSSERLGIPVKVMRFDQLNASGQYDAVVASASLLHVPRSGLPNVLARIWMALKPGGWHIASFKGGGAEGRDCFGRYFNYLTETEIADYYKAGGDWAFSEIWSGMGGGYDGKQGPWHAITVRKTAD